MPVEPSQTLDAEVSAGLFTIDYMSSVSARLVCVFLLHGSWLYSTDAKDVEDFSINMTVDFVFILLLGASEYARGRQGEVR